MEKIPFGNTGLMITRLGVGLSELGELSLTSEDVKTAGDVLNSALDGGINLLDTAACYDNSEELVGRTVSSRRDEYILASKCGHVAGGYQGEDWDRKTVEDSIDRSLKRLQTDHVDIMQLHSCGIDVLERGEVIDALVRAREAGKIRFVSYSGDNEDALWAVDSGHFDSLQTSFSLVDQHARTRGVLANAAAKGMGIILKRPIGNAVWKAASSTSSYADEYFRRAQAMQSEGPIANEPDDRIMTSLAFVFAHPEPHTAILGTSNPAHMRSNIEMVNAGLAIPDGVVAELHGRFENLGADWEQRT